MCAPESVSSPKDQQGRHTQIPALKEANVHVPLTTTGGDLPPRVHRIRSPLKTHTNSGAGVRGKAMHTLGVSRGCDILSDQQAWKLTWFVQLQFLIQAEELSIVVYKMWSKDPKEFWQPALETFFIATLPLWLGWYFHSWCKGDGPICLRTSMMK